MSVSVEIITARAWISLCSFSSMFAYLRVRRPRLLVPPDSWKYNISLVSKLSAIRACLLLVFVRVTMSFLGMRIFYAIPMYHQQGMLFLNMLSVHSLCFNYIDQRGNYFCSMHQIFHYDLHMVNLISSQKNMKMPFLCISPIASSLTAMHRTFLQNI